MNFKSGKLVILTILGIIAVSLAFSYIVSIRQYDYAKNELIDKSRVLARQIMATRQFLATNQDLINRDSNNHFEFKGLNPARGIFLISQYFNENIDYQIKQAAFPATVRNLQNMPDAWEMETLNRFKSDSHLIEYYGEIEEESGKYFRYAIPLYIDQSCLTCHGEPAGIKDIAGFPKEGHKIGDLRGIVSITVPMAGFDATYQTLVYKLLAGGTALGIFVSLSVALILYFVFFRPAQKQIVRASQLAAAGHVTAAAAHEINNPLSIISARSELILEEENLPEQVKEDVQVIQQCVGRVSSYMRGLLSLARPLGGEAERVNLNQALDESVFLLEKQLSKHGIAIERDYADPAPETWGQMELLKQVFFNLLANARDALPDGGTITLKTGSQGTQVFAEVRDNGKGIHPQELAHIFDPFYTTKKNKGTGLGLAICQNLIHDSRGRITVESRIDEGTCFKIVLPQYAPKAVNSSEEES